MTNTSTVISAFQGDPWAPNYEVLVGDMSMSPRTSTDILDIHVTLDLKGAGAFSLTVADWDDVDLVFKYSSGHLFDLGRLVSIDLGYVDDLVRVINGEVISLTPWPTGNHSRVSRRPFGT
jgi:hypothetical protein